MMYRPGSPSAPRSPGWLRRLSGAPFTNANRGSLAPAPFVHIRDNSSDRLFGSINSKRHGCRVLPYSRVERLETRFTSPKLRVAKVVSSPPERSQTVQRDRVGLRRLRVCGRDFNVDNRLAESQAYGWGDTTDDTPTDPNHHNLLAPGHLARRRRDSSQSQSWPAR